MRSISHTCLNQYLPFCSFFLSLIKHKQTRWPNAPTNIQVCLVNLNSTHVRVQVVPIRSGMGSLQLYLLMGLNRQPLVAAAHEGVPAGARGYGCPLLSAHALLVQRHPASALQVAVAPVPAQLAANAVIAIQRADRVAHPAAGLTVYLTDFLAAAAGCSDGHVMVVQVSAALRVSASGHQISGQAAALPEK